MFVGVYLVGGRVHFVRNAFIKKCTFTKLKIIGDLQSTLSFNFYFTLVRFEAKALHLLNLNALSTYG